MDLALDVMQRFSDLVDVSKVLHMIPNDDNIKIFSKFLEVSRPSNCDF